MFAKHSTLRFVVEVLYGGCLDVMGGKLNKITDRNVFRWSYWQLLNLKSTLYLKPQKLFDSKKQSQAYKVTQCPEKPPRFQEIPHSQVRNSQ